MFGTSVLNIKKPVKKIQDNLINNFDEYISSFFVKRIRKVNKIPKNANQPILDSNFYRKILNYLNRLYQFQIFGLLVQYLLEQKF